MTKAKGAGAMRGCKETALRKTEPDYRESSARGLLVRSGRGADVGGQPLADGFPVLHRREGSPPAHSRSFRGDQEREG